MFRKIVKAVIPTSIFGVIEPTGHLLEAVMWQCVYGFPARNLKVIGVTGTNGKTTTCLLIQRMLHEAGFKVGVMTTVGYGVGKSMTPQMTHMTTAGTRVLLNRIKQMRSEGIEWLVLETTSHALAQNRVWGIPYSVAVMTNITHEHLAYHKTFERYRAAKVKLFQLAAKNRRGLHIGIVNADDPSEPYFVAAVPKFLRYSVTRRQADLFAAHIEPCNTGSHYQMRYQGRTLSMSTKLPGSFNVSNSLAAAGVGLALGLTDEQVQRGVAALETVEGRMNVIDEGQNFTVMVDYAHSPDSFERLFSDLKPNLKGRMIAVFGSQGSTGDKAKRSIQGELAGRFCDLVVVTEEDDRGEDGMAIMKEIAEGAKRAGKVVGKDLILIHSRPEAIQFAMDEAKAHDTVLLLGKGHEKTIERNAEGEEPWDEPGEARKALKARKALR